MERRSCSNLHFINAIKGNSETKLSNVNSRGKPALIFRKLIEICNTDDLNTTSHSFLHSDSKFSRVKMETPCLPLADRTLQEIDIATNGAVHSGDDGEMYSDLDDYTFGKMTLKQLKQNCKTKKRIRASSEGLSPQNGDVKLEPDEDDSDLNETLCSLKLKLSKAKKKCISGGSQSPKLAVSVKSEQGLDSGSPVLIHGDLASVICVKTEVPEPEFEGCLSIVSFDDNSFTIDQNDESSIAQGISDENPRTVECRSSKPNQYGEEYHSCVLNQVSHDHLDNFEPPSVVLPSSEELMDVNNQEKTSQQFLDLPMSEFGIENQIEQPLEITSPSKDQSPDMHGYSRSCHLHELSGQNNNNPVVLVPDTVVDVSFNRNELYCGGDSDEENQPSMSTRTDAERDSSLWNKNYAFEETPSPSVLVQTPERLLSTRKVISPTSEEQFCLAMNSTESYNDMDCPNCKENLHDVKQTENKSSCEGSDKLVNVSKSPKVSAAVSRTKLILSPSQLRRKMKNLKTSPPKCNLEGPRLSRSLPSVSTGCTSVQGCSESAIAFSRRQMHDIESLAMKLMGELKSMKDIVEEKLLFEAYCNVSLKNDADEVKNAITNATKAEEMARKWLSMMGRDCNRFCKIMSLTQKGTKGALSSDVGQRERKRITFADEAGGMLCHVKFFENGLASHESTSINQEDQTT
ncbi:hypothetical protein ACH5RR_035127 [Cinchona calisaya]|uniref:Uncharacterized protein n=1 Tax=Cinchona calisaya TaxID=153742 RepID=A0ABD2YF06_9GENT